MIDGQITYQFIHQIVAQRRIGKKCLALLRVIEQRYHAQPHRQSHRIVSAEQQQGGQTDNFFMAGLIIGAGFTDQSAQ